MDISTLIGPALDRAAEAEMSEATITLSALREAITGCEDALRIAARRRALASMMAAIGQALPREEESGLASALATLRSTANGAIAWMDAERARQPKNGCNGVATVLTTPVQQLPAPPTTPVLATQILQVAQLVVAETTPVVEAPKPTQAEDPPSRETLRFVYSVLHEVAEVRHKLGTMHPLRAVPWLQALVADLRRLLPKLPLRHPLFRKVENAITEIGTLKKQQPWAETQFVRGLAYKDQFDDGVDWTQLAYASRAKVRKFDADAEAAPPSKPVVARPKPEKPKPVEPLPSVEPEAPPEWIFLRKAISKDAVLIVGNVKKVQDRAEQLRRKLLLDPEWCIIDNDKDSPRQVERVAQRIAAGTVAAVVILEGYVHHRVTKKIESACFDSRVPYAYGNKGGTGEIREALADLDRQLGSIEHFGVPFAALSSALDE